jgi:hypothetical protein
VLSKCAASGSPSWVRVCGCLRHLRKKQVLGISDLVPCVFCQLLLMCAIFLNLLADFRVCQRGVSVWLPAALWQTQKKDAAGILDHCVLSMRVAFVRDFDYRFAGHRVYKQDARLCGCLRRFGACSKIGP